MKKLFKTSLSIAFVLSVSISNSFAAECPSCKKSETQIMSLSNHVSDAAKHHACSKVVTQKNGEEVIKLAPGAQLDRDFVIDKHLAYINKRKEFVQTLFGNIADDINSANIKRVREGSANLLRFFEKHHKPEKKELGQMLADYAIDKGAEAVKAKEAVEIGNIFIEYFDSKKTQDKWVQNFKKLESDQISDEKYMEYIKDLYETFANNIRNKINDQQKDVQDIRAAYELEHKPRKISIDGKIIRCSKNKFAVRLDGNRYRCLSRKPYITCSDAMRLLEEHRQSTAKFFSQLSNDLMGQGLGTITGKTELTCENVLNAYSYSKKGCRKGIPMLGVEGMLGKTTNKKLLCMSALPEIARRANENGKIRDPKAPLRMFPSELQIDHGIGFKLDVIGPERTFFRGRYKCSATVNPTVDGKFSFSLKSGETRQTISANSKGEGLRLEEYYGDGFMCANKTLHHEFIEMQKRLSEINTRLGDAHHRMKIKLPGGIEVPCWMGTATHCVMGHMSKKALEKEKIKLTNQMEDWLQKNESPVDMSAFKENYFQAIEKNMFNELDCSIDEHLGDVKSIFTETLHLDQMDLYKK